MKRIRPNSLCLIRANLEIFNGPDNSGHLAEVKRKRHAGSDNGRARFDRPTIPSEQLISVIHTSAQEKNILQGLFVMNVTSGHNVNMYLFLNVHHRRFLLWDNCSG
jgi:hypothetical protein